MFNIREVLEGWRNSLIPPKNLKQIIKHASEERLKICDKCEFNSIHATKFSGYSSIRTDYHCVSCGCPLKKKTKCLSCKCPKDKWEAYVTDEEESKLMYETH